MDDLLDWQLDKAGQALDSVLSAIRASGGEGAGGNSAERLFNDVGDGRLSVPDIHKQLGEPDQLDKSTVEAKEMEIRTKLALAFFDTEIDADIKVLQDDKDTESHSGDTIENHRWIFFPFASTTQSSFVWRSSDPPPAEPHSLERRSVSTTSAFAWWSLQPRREATDAVAGKTVSVAPRSYNIPDSSQKFWRHSLKNTWISHAKYMK